MKKFLAAVFAVMLLMLTLAGCYNPATVATIGDEEIPAGVYLFFQIEAMTEASGELENVTGKELYAKELDGVPVRDWIAAKTVEKLQEYVFVLDEFERLELEDSSVDMMMSIYASTLQQEWNYYGSFYTRNGISYATYQKIYRYSLMRDVVFATLYSDEGAPNRPPDAEIIDYYKENYTYLDYIKLRITDANSIALTDAQIEELKDFVYEMKGIAETTVADSDTGEVYVDETNVGLEAAFTAYAAQAGATAPADLETLRTRTFSQNVTFLSTTTSYNENFVKAVYAAAPDVYTVYIDGNDIYLFCRRSMHDADEESWKDHAEDIIKVLKGDEFSAYVAEGAKALDFTGNTRAQKYYSIDKIRTS